jgi:hypothetical protein
MTPAVSQARTPILSVYIELTECPAALLLPEEQRVPMQSQGHKKGWSSAGTPGKGGVTDHNSSSCCLGQVAYSGEIAPPTLCMFRYLLLSWYQGEASLSVYFQNLAVASNMCSLQV